MKRPFRAHHEATADLTNGLAVVLAEIRNGLEVRRQMPRQPDQLDITLAFAHTAWARSGLMHRGKGGEIQRQRTHRALNRSASTLAVKLARRPQRGKSARAKFAKIQDIETV